MDQEQHEAQQIHSQALMDSEILIAWGAQTEGLILWASPAWRRFTGVSHQHQNTHHWQAHLHPEDKQRFEKSGQQIQPAQEFRLLHHDGTFHSVLGYVHFSDETPASMSGHFAACFETLSSATDTDTPPSYPDSIQQDASVSGEQDFIFDHKSIRTLFDNDPNALRELADLFDETCEETLGFLASGFDSPDPSELFSTAHRLKGAVANMSAPQILESCQKLEQAITESDLHSAEQISHEVIQRVSQLRVRVNRELRG